MIGDGNEWIAIVFVLLAIFLFIHVVRRHRTRMARKEMTRLYGDDWK
jgi:Flp pilus assembly protein TadB